MTCHMFSYMALKFHPALSRAIKWSFCDKFLNDRDPLFFSSIFSIETDSRYTFRYYFLLQVPKVMAPRQGKIFFRYVSSVLWDALLENFTKFAYLFGYKTGLSYDVAVNRMTTRVITLWRVYVTSLTTSMSTMWFLR